MSILNYTTKIDAGKTVGEMQQALAKAGANSVSVEYDNGSPVGLSFLLVTPHGPRHFTLPVNVHAMHRLLIAEDKAGRLGSLPKAIRSSGAQAERVAWRIMKDWLLAQLALVATDMAGLDQVMLPYIQVGDLGQTLYDTYKEREVLAIESGEAGR